MNCEHERLRTVGENDVFCCLCGKKLTLEFFMNRNASVNGENRANNTGAETNPNKTASRKRTTKKPV